MKHLKTFLYFEGNTVANEVLIYASLMNAGVKPIEAGVRGLHVFAHVMADKLDKENTQVELIGGDTLHIDVKIGNQYETVLRVEEVEVMEMESINEDEEDKVNILSASKID